jgi:glycosyltransferase involved in cell wall biosynthesis
MDYSSISRNDPETLPVCIIIPTYNNAATLAGVINDVSQYHKDIIVVNDGSTDNTEEIVKSCSNIQYIGYKKNAGKGWALRKAFEYALSKGYSYAITIDSDGQHFAKDLPAFFARLKQDQNAIIIGSRNMDQDSVPGGSSFGNKFSNFWFKVETGMDCSDTQSGFRLYPLQQLKNFYFITRKYEFEIEVLVRAAWKGIHVVTVPISVFYAPKETRVSHFRPYKDFFRISILNTILVIIAFLYIKPRNFFRSISLKKLRRHLYKELFKSKQSDRIKALSVAFGVFMGIIPIWGFQLIAAIALAIIFRLNKALVIIAANISIPPMIPLIIYLSYVMGAWWMGAKASYILFDKNLSFQSVSNHITQYIYGSITLAVIAAIILGMITYITLKFFKKISK